MKKPENLGQLVRAWREASGLSYAAMAKLISAAMGKYFKYQNLQNLEKEQEIPIERPLYLHELAIVMGTTTGDLLALKMPPPLGAPRDTAQGSPDEPERGTPNVKVTEFSRNDFMRIYDTLTPSQTQLLARLMSAVGLVPGSEVEVTLRWKSEGNSGEPTKISDGLNVDQGRAKRLRT